MDSRALQWAIIINDEILKYLSAEFEKRIRLSQQRELLRNSFFFVFSIILTHLTIITFFSHSVGKSLISQVFSNECRLFGMFWQQWSSRFLNLIFNFVKKKFEITKTIFYFSCVIRNFLVENDTRRCRDNA